MNHRIQTVVKPVLDRVAEAHRQMNTPLFDQKYTSLAIAPREDTQYAILKELRILNKKKLLAKQPINNEVVIFYDAQDGTLSRTIDSKEYTYNFKKEAKRKKLFDTLRLKKSFLQLKELKIVLGSPTTDSVSTMIKTLNGKVKLELHLKINIIVSKPGFGYRINPNVIIERV
jgi:hypothetical protein